MKSPRLACLSTILLSTLMLAQSNPVPLTNQPLVTKNPPSGLSQPDPTAQGRIVESYGKLPLSFEANKGQSDARVKFLSRGSGYTLFLTGDEAVFSLRGSKSNDDATSVKHHLRPGSAAPTTDAVLRMRLLHANPAAKVTGTDELPGKSNYFIGNDPKKWRSNISTYGTVKYEGVYPGVDLVFYGNQRQLEYDFVVAPGYNPRCIQFDVRGAKRIRRDKDGDLVLHIAGGEVRWRKPVVYQVKDGTRQWIDGRYVIKHRQRVSFEVERYDSQRPLIIDPILGYSTYLGGNETDQGQGIAVDSAGSAYITGFTTSTNFPTMDPLQPSYGGSGDAFVTKLNPSGSALVYSTYLGGSGGDSGYGIAVDSSGNAYVTGRTTSVDFPITPGAFQTTCSGGCINGVAFLTKLNPTGSALVYSTYLGGSGGDSGQSIAVDGSGNAHVTGNTSSTNFPTMNPLQPTYGGGRYDSFVSELSPSGSALLYSTYLGGSGEDAGDGWRKRGRLRV